jgi:esterase/lipase superfamily enzyme
MRLSTLTIVSLLLTAMMAAGCASGGGPYEIFLMPAPEVYDDGNIDPFIHDDPIARESHPGMLYATDRAPAEPDDKRYAYYTNQRGHVVRLGSASIEFGHDESITWDEARRISLRKNRTEDYPLKIGDVEEFGTLARTIRPFDEGIEASEEPARRFIAEIDRRLARSKSNDVYISEESQAERIHILGYSAGTRLVSRLLADIGMLAYGLDDEELERRVRLGHVILAGSDIDRAIIGGYILDGALRVPESVTIYGSDADKALGISRFVFSRNRIGQVSDTDEIGPRTAKFFRETDKLRLIDVSNAEGSKAGNGHRYFRSSPWVSSDILVTLLYDLAPADRGLVWGEAMPVWTFPDDYTERMLKALAAANPALFPDTE